MDSIRVKVSGEGEWKVRTHGVGLLMLAMTQKPVRKPFPTEKQAMQALMGILVECRGVVARLFNEQQKATFIRIYINGYSKPQPNHSQISN
ncbi:hypothetical protein [Dendronalium phyllosphericum]|uniref:hypothetical protein n=1 Tax=Dendronalium phyllosphericum TaxID=2840445 RepID=UPI001CEDDE5A|nr:hypothetical protein [Dendronalium phyllosphericum]